MFSPVSSFSGFSIDDFAKAKAFYSETLGLQTEELMEGMLQMSLPGGQKTIAYVKEGHQPATYTTLNFVVEDIDAAVAALKEKGVIFERYEDMNQDEAGIARGRAANMGPDIAWFKDPAGNILSVLQDS